MPTRMTRLECDEVRNVAETSVPTVPPTEWSSDVRLETTPVTCRAANANDIASANTTVE